MTINDKYDRVYKTLMELDILHISHQLIGSPSIFLFSLISDSLKSISGGERRRVSIACELVTNPGIIFLDEPTSGLDSYNALNVIEALVGLAKQFNKTVILSIHQPRSNIFSMLDQLVLLAKGKMIYSGPAQDSAFSHFSNIGFSCPIGYNLADYLSKLLYRH
jgi:ABC-type multidrug transport system ATPase subunit